VPDNLPAQMDGSFADRSVERHRLPDRLWRRYGTSDDLDQRDKVRRIEWMADDATLGVGQTAGLDLAHCQAGRARCDNDVRGHQSVEPPIEVLLQIDALRAVFLDKRRRRNVEVLRQALDRAGEVG